MWQRAALGENMYVRGRHSWTVARCGLLSALVMSGCVASAKVTDKKANSHAGMPEAQAPHPTARRLAYRRYEPGRGMVESERYTQDSYDWGQAEGTLLLRDVHPIARWLDPPARAADQPLCDWPKGGGRNAGALFLEFDPPVIEWPGDLPAVGSHVQVGKVTAYGARGVPFARGSVTRTVHGEGLDDIALSDIHYAACLRLTSRTELRFGFWSTVRLEERVWLVDGIGIVRREQRVVGVAMLLFPFGSRHVYELASHEPLAVAPRERALRGRRWHRLAIYLDRVIPRPRVSGLVVEWAP